ncbi:MAG: ferrochelatase [Pseudomonadota bacterium]|nr:ferrochelatase [Pseudomonadota bacterium]
MTRDISQPDFAHDRLAVTGVLLVNLGSPDAPTRSAVRRYLEEFLWDPRVVEAPRWLWWLVLRLIILNIRPGRSARNYRKIWTESGAPLVAISSRLADALKDRLADSYGEGVRVALAMRYGNPSVRAGLETLRNAGARRILVLPLYPQYSATTTASVFDAVADELKHWRWLPEVRFVNGYADDPEYIRALAGSIEAHWRQHERAARLLFSFHGIPKRYFRNGDPYHCQCQKTARLVAEALGLEPGQWQVAFQSRFGREEWLTPYMDHVLGGLPGKGIASVDVVCPGFSIDCLETLEEIDMQNREIFLSAGGQRFHYIAALNDSADHVTALGSLVDRHIGGWPKAGTGYDRDQQHRLARLSRERAIAMGADR